MISSPVTSSPPSAVAAPPRALASVGSRTSYSGAGSNGNIALWRPPLKSADGDMLRDAGVIRARARDLRRNHPYAQQAVRASRLGVIGKRLRYSCRPDYRFLGISPDEAARWGQEFERLWETYAHGRGAFVDAGRRLNFTQMMSLAHDCLFTDGEFVAGVEWDWRRRWRTCLQAIDADRLSNPNGAPETPWLKAGVALDDMSAPIGYHIRDSHPSDSMLIGARYNTHSFVPRETQWGRPVMLHVYEMERPGQTRGISAFASVIATMKMGAEYTETALQQAILQSSYAAVLVSQANYKDALEIINGMSPDEAKTVTELAEENLLAAMEHHERIRLRFNGAQIPVLWPGDDLKMMSPATGAVSIGEFQAHATKSYAAGTGTDPIQVSQDYSQVNYSSVKMAAATSYRHYEARRQILIDGVAHPTVAGYLEEVVHSGALHLPKGIKPHEFYDAQNALCAGVFLTQGAPSLDPLKEAQAMQLELGMGMATLQDSLAERGIDYIECLDQLAFERTQRAMRGIPNPGELPWQAASAGDPAQPQDGG